MVVHLSRFFVESVVEDAVEGGWVSDHEDFGVAGCHRSLYGFEDFGSDARGFVDDY